MKKSLLSLTLAFSSIFTLPSEAGLKVYYLRHAETGSNVTKAWKDVPKEQWPDWVGDGGRFTPLGEKQIAGIADKLRPYQFDFVAVSPTKRTRETVLPYLQEHQLKAEIWPELIEFGGREGDTKLIGKSDLPAPDSELFTGGNPIKVPEEQTPYFKILDNAQTTIKLGRGGAPGAADLTEMLNKLISKVRGDFGGTDKSILLVGHGVAGRHVLKMLTNDPEATKRVIANTGVWMAEEQPDGTFKIMMVNDELLD